MLFPSAALAASSTSVSDYEAILQQLAKLHKEIKALRSEVEQLRKAVTEITLCLRINADSVQPYTRI